jgi:hypothetical protein
VQKKPSTSAEEMRGYSSMARAASGCVAGPCTLDLYDRISNYLAAPAQRRCLLRQGLHRRAWHHCGEVCDLRDHQFLSSIPIDARTLPDPPAHGTRLVCPDLRAQYGLDAYAQVHQMDAGGAPTPGSRVCRGGHGGVRGSLPGAQPGRDRLGVEALSCAGAAGVLSPASQRAPAEGMRLAHADISMRTSGRWLPLVLRICITVGKG